MPVVNPGLLRLPPEPIQELGAPSMFSRQWLQESPAGQVLHALMSAAAPATPTGIGNQLLPSQVPGGAQAPLAQRSLTAQDLATALPFLLGGLGTMRGGDSPIESLRQLLMQRTPGPTVARGTPAEMAQKLRMQQQGTAAAPPTMTPEDLDWARSIVTSLENAPPERRLSSDAALLAHARTLLGQRGAAPGSRMYREELKAYLESKSRRTAHEEAMLQRLIQEGL